MSLTETRGHQMFPELEAGQIETAKRFASGPAREFAPGEIVYDVGERQAPAWLVLEGSIDAIGRDGRGVESHITTHHAGQFSGELSQLAGRQSLAMGRAGPDGATAIPFDDVHVRALMIGSAEIGEIMMRAFILRRVGLIDEGRAGSTLIGTPGTPDLARIEGFLRPQRLSLHGARSGEGPGSRGLDRTRRRLRRRTAGDVLSERPGVAASDRCGGGRLSRHHAGTRCRETVRRCRCRRGARGACHRRVCRLGRPVGARARRPRFRRSGGRVGAHRELFRLPHRHQRHET